MPPALQAVAEGRVRPYLVMMLDVVSSSRPASRFWLLSAGLFGVMLALAVALWMHYGTAVFYEIILAGLAACF